MNVDRWTVRRFRDPKLQPIALWDAHLGGEDDQVPSVYERLGRVRVDAMRREGVEDERIAGTLAADLVEVLRDLHDSTEHGEFDDVFVEGRALELTGFRAALSLQQAPFSLAMAPPRPSCAELGAERLLERVAPNESPKALIVDIGHTAVRTTVLGRNPTWLVRERNLIRLPMARGSIPPPTKPDPTPYVERGVAFVCRALVHGLAEAGPANPRVILSFPCSLDDHGCPGRCTYPGWEGNDRLASLIVEGIEEHLAQTTMSFAPFGHDESRHMWLVTHPELVALGSEAVLGPPRGRGTMAVSLGFGPSAALLRGHS